VHTRHLEVKTFLGVLKKVKFLQVFARTCVYADSAHGTKSGINPAKKHLKNTQQFNDFVGMRAIVNPLKKLFQSNLDWMWIFQSA